MGQTTRRSKLTHVPASAAVLGICSAVVVVCAFAQSGALGVVLSTNAVTFSGFTGGDIPAAQSLSVTSSSTQLQPYSVRLADTSPPVCGWFLHTTPWLSVTPIKGMTPARLQVSVDTSCLAAGSFSNTIIVSSPGSPDQTVSVAVTVTDSPAILNVAPSSLRFEAQQGTDSVQRQGFYVGDSGGGSGILTFKASIAGGSSWLSIDAESCRINPYAPTPLGVVVNPAGLAQGVYRDVVHIESSFGSFDAPVSLVVGQPGPALGLNFTGLLFETRQGNGDSNTRNVLVLNQGTGTVNWQTELLSGSEWLSLSNASARGQATPQNASRLALTANPGALGPGVYYSLIRISDPAALDSPQYFTAVLHVTAHGDPANPDPAPQGLFFVSQAGGPPPATQPVRLFVSSDTPLPFQASASTVDGANWLTIDQSSGVTSTQNTAVLNVTAALRNFRPESIPATLLWLSPTLPSAPPASRWSSPISPRPLRIRNHEPLPVVSRRACR